MILKLLQNIVGFLAATVTIAQMFTGMFMCRVISKKGSTRNIPSMPFIGGLVISTLLLYQARLIGDRTMSLVNALGVLVNAGYIMFYYFWSKKKMKDNFIRNLSWSMIAVGVLLFYAQLEDPAKVETRFSVIVSVVTLSFIASPLLSLPEIMEKRSTEGLPYPMIISGFVVSTLWTLYAILIGNVLLAIQNGVASLISGSQLYLFSIYPSKPTKTAMKFE